MDLARRKPARGLEEPQKITAAEGERHGSGNFLVTPH